MARSYRSTGASRRKRRRRTNNRASIAAARRRLRSRKKPVQKTPPPVEKVKATNATGVLHYTRLKGEIVLDEKRSWGVEFEKIMAARKKEEEVKKTKPPKPKVVEVIEDPEVDIPISDAVRLLSGIDSNLKVDEFSLQEEYDYPIDFKDNRRNNNEVILSKEGGKRNFPLKIASARVVFEKATMKKFVDVEIKELVDPKSVKVQIKKNTLKYGTPKIDQFEWWGLRMIRVDNYKSLVYSPQWSTDEIRQLTYMAKEEGEKHVWTNRANSNFCIVADAYNYKDDKNKKNRDNIKYTWKFTSSANNYDVIVQNKILHHGRVLNIKNAQRHHTGRYTCEITNDKGNSYTKTIYVVIHRTGHAKAIENSINGVKVPTGKKVWVDTDPGYDKKFIHTNRHAPIYDIASEAWMRQKWNGNSWDIEKDNMHTEVKTKMDRIALERRRKDTSTRQRDYGYWRLPGSHDIYFSNNKGVVKFKNGWAMLHHKFANKMPLNFGSFDNISPGERNRYTKVGDEITIYDEEITTI